MLLEEAQNRARHIAEDLEDAEVAEALLSRLSWDVLVAIATGRCEGAPPKDFAAAVVGAELTVHENFGSALDHHVGVRARLEAQNPTPAKGKRRPTTTKPAAKKRAPGTKKPAKGKQPPGRAKKRG